MGLFSGLFGHKRTKEEQKNRELPFTLLNNEEQIDEIIGQSENKLIAIFKHSTRCGTSRMAFRAFKDGFDSAADEVAVYVLDILTYRAISDEVSRQFQVLHESPQLILIKEGKAVDAYSHHRISPAVLEEYIKK